jgi:hypothetical protein
MRVVLLLALFVERTRSNDIHIPVHHLNPGQDFKLHGTFPEIITAREIGGTGIFDSNEFNTELVPGEAIPRHMWTFWNTEEMPTIVAACISVMNKHNPTWKVHMLSTNAVGIEAPPPESRQAFADQPALEADWYRVAAVAQYGGVYLDSTVLLHKPLGATWPHMKQNVMQGFNCPNTQNDTNPLCLESFAFAAPPRNPLVMEWKKEFRKALMMGCDSYCDSLPEFMKGTLTEYLPYLCVYAAFQSAQHRMRQVKTISYPTQGCRLPNDECGPYHFIDAPDSPDYSHLMRLFGHGVDEGSSDQTLYWQELQKTPVIKFMSSHRSQLEDAPKMWQNTTSYMGKILVDALQHSLTQQESGGPASTAFVIPASAPFNSQQKSEEQEDMELNSHGEPKEAFQKKGKSPFKGSFFGERRKEYP